MIADLCKAETAIKRTPDVCIIGGGTAGLTLAREFLGSGCSVVVLESGGTAVEERTQALYRCDVTGLPHRGHMHGRFRTLGGTSTRWGGQLLPLTRYDIEARGWLCAGAWPVSYYELDSYYRRVEGLFEVDSLPYETDERNPLPIGKAEFRSDVFATRYAKWPPFGKRSLARLVGPACAKASNVEVVLHANVTDVCLNGGGAQVVAVRARSLTGASLEVRAKYVVVCTGTIETIRILLASRNVAKTGIGNHSDQLGRNFQDHLSFRAAELTLRDRREAEKAFAPFFIGDTMRSVRLELSSSMQRQEKLLSCFGQVLFEMPERSGFAELREGLRRLQARQNPWPDFNGWTTIARDLPYMLRLGYARYVQHRVTYPDDARAYLQVDVEQKPNPESRVSLSRTSDELGIPLVRLDWQVGDLEQRSVRKFVRLFRAEWERHGLGGANWNATIEREGEAWLRECLDVYHQTGGTCMHDDPAAGVVDSRLQVHGVENLFVASCSVFPTAGSANPTFTLLALTVRLADHLKKLLGASSAELCPDVSGRSTIIPPLPDNAHKEPL